MRPAIDPGLLLPPEAAASPARPLCAAPPVTTTHPRHSPLSSVPIYWHLLSCDAPTVAVLWAWSFVRAAHLRLAVGEIAVLGIGTWLIYVLDRILDSRPGADHCNLKERHIFHARHRRPLLAACSAVLLPLLWLIAAHMSAASRRDDTVLFAASVLYFALVHVPGLRPGWRFPRELAVGILFALATAVPAWAQSDRAHTGLALPVLLFAALCSLNCLAIESWERPAGLPHNRIVGPMAGCIAAGAIGLILNLALAPSSHSSGEECLAAAILVAALLLLALHDQRHRISLLALRIAADAALLTPLLVGLPWRR